MKCCNRNCNEGRDCPHRTVDPRPFAALGIVAIAALFVAVLVIARGVW